jgi:hypothetical protein
LSQLVHAQSGSFGSTYAHTGMEMAIFGQHNFVTGSGTINAGIVGSERQSAIGVYSFVNPSGSWISASYTAFIDGYVRTYNTGAFTFPIGDNNKYRPAAVSASSSSAPTTAAYFGVDPGLATTSDLKGGTYGILPGGGPAFSTTSKDAIVGTVDNVEYWDIDGTTPARITLTWDANTPITSLVGTDLTKLTIVGWDGTKWVVIPSTVDAGSLLQTTSASTFTGPAGTVSAGSITTNATVVPDSFTVYTLAGICTVTQVIADVTSLTICSGEQVAINYTTVAPGGQVQWTRHASDGSADIAGIGNIIDFPPASGNVPVSYTYTATSAESFGCSSNTMTTGVTVNPVPTITPSFCSQTICSGDTGSITFEPSIPNSTIHWERTPTTPAPSSGTGNIGQTLINTGPTSLTYTYRIWAISPAPALCASTDTITCTIVVKSTCCDLVASIATNPTTTCTSVADGSLTITYTGADTYQYKVNSGAFQPLGASPFMVTGLAAGSYTVVVQGISSPTCISVLTGEIVTPTVPVVSTVVVTDPTDCTLNNGGLVVVLVNSAEGMFEYSIDNGTTWVLNNTFSGLAAGNYTILIRNASAPTCFVDAGSFTIQAPGGITADINGANQDVCEQNQCTITITASGGSETYEYSLDGGLTWADMTANPQVLTNKAPMNYYVVVRDKANPSCAVSQLLTLDTQECIVPMLPAPIRE